MTPLEKLVTADNDARALGFCYPTIQDVVNQLLSECREVVEACEEDHGDDRIQEVIGDVIHAAIILCLKQGFDLDQTLDVTANKFIKRMDALKSIMKEKGLSTLEDKSLEYKLSLWRLAKKSAYEGGS